MCLTGSAPESNYNEFIFQHSKNRCSLSTYCGRGPEPGTCHAVTHSKDLTILSIKYSIFVSQTTTRNSEKLSNLPKFLRLMNEKKIRIIIQIVGFISHVLSSYSKIWNPSQKYILSIPHSVDFNYSYYFSYTGNIYAYLYHICHFIVSFHMSKQQMLMIKYYFRNHNFNVSLIFYHLE